MLDMGRAHTPARAKRKTRRAPLNLRLRTALPVLDASPLEAGSMFEGKPLQAPDSRNSATGDTPEDRLCELHWGDLVARLSAARELRAELAASDAGALASFDACSARHLASQHESYRADKDERDVNPDDLGNGKWPAAEHEARADRETPATRGNT